ncbi:MAG: hypothetical protein RLZZ584_1784 [Pseudomonadota bacterium]
MYPSKPVINIPPPETPPAAPPPSSAPATATAAAPAEHVPLADLSAWQFETTAADPADGDDAADASLPPMPAAELAALRLVQAAAPGPAATATPGDKAGLLGGGRPSGRVLQQLHARSAALPPGSRYTGAGRGTPSLDPPVFEALPEFPPEPLARPRLVGIGASAGGLEALRLLLPTLPGDAGITYVVLQHLAPTHRSMMAEILASRSLMPVREVRDGDGLGPNEILICPPNAHIEYDSEFLRLREPEPQALPRPSINLFFSSLAERMGPAAVGVILSGTGSDGSLGLRQIKAAGGYALVQQPSSARYSGMPEAAIRTVGHDLVLPPEEIGPAIARLCATAITPEAADPERPVSVQARDQLFELIARVRLHCGIDFGEYKEGTLLRRIARRLQARGAATLDDYLLVCEHDPSELDELARDTLISVTSFWRDKAAFDTLLQALAALVATRPDTEPLRIWVPGCATGEEACSILMAFAEVLGNSLSERPLQMFATDVDLEALRLARRGLYPASSLNELPPALRSRYFTAVGSQYEFSRMLRERVVYSRHDLTRDPPFPRLDLLSCRNVLIYLKPEAQARVMRSFHYALRPAGLLLLGQSESVLHHEDLFRSISTEARLYERSTSHALARSPDGVLERNLPGPAPAALRRASPAEPELLLLRRAGELYLPPCVLLDEQLHVQQVHGDVTPFFALRPGPQQFDVVSLARTEIESDLRLLVALQGDSRETRHCDVAIGKGRARTAWRLVLHPIEAGQGRRRSLLVFVRRGVARGKAAAADGGGALAVADTTELHDARERLKSLVEQLEASNEEMQALNEEAQATNEEMQASNEELEAANEEMLATNQELSTVNAELNHQWRRYQQLTEELQSIYNSVDLPLLVLDEALAIRRYNDAAARLFSLSPGCEGLQLATMQRPAGMPDLVTHVTQAQASASPLVVHLPATQDGREFVLHLAHNVLGGERRGVVLTLVDNTELARAERHTRSIEQRLLAVLTHGSALVAIKDAAGRYEFTNPRYARYLGVEPAALAGRTDAQCLSAGLAAQLRKGDIEVLHQGDTVEREESFSVDGQRRVWWAARFPIHDADGAISSVCLQAIDLTSNRAADDELRIAAKVFDTTTEGVMITDPEHRILRVNDAFTRITGYGADEVRGKTPRVIASGRHDDAFYAAMWEEIDRSGAWQGEIWNKRKSGEVYPEWLSINVLRDATGRVTHYVGVFTDVTTLTETREHMRRMATHDVLTGLPNRTLLQDRLSHAIASARRHTAELALVFLDLDNFKTINDSLGHEAGDELLRLAARRICDNVRSADTVARIGGDEFVLLLENTSRHECLQTVERINRALGENAELRGSLITCAASLGVAMYPGDGADAAALMRNADAAMYRAKRAGRSRYEFFSAEVGESARNRLAVESGLRQALQAGELSLEYQPQFDIATGQLAGIEALLRWRTHDGARIAPSIFLPIAEETALIDLIGDWVIGTACAQLAAWRSTGLPGVTGDICLSVNVSPRQLRDRQFAEKLQHHMVTHRISGRQLVLEVTESALIQQSEHLTQLLRRLDQLGVQLSLDDFGTGFSSLAHLRQLPLDELKIDRSFVAGMTDRRDDREIVDAILGLARALGLRVVAEGVETQAQLDHLHASGHAILAQGFLYTPALPPEQLHEWLLARLLQRQAQPTGQPAA